MGILGAAAGGWLESDQTFLAHVSTWLVSVGRAALVATVATQSRTFQPGTGWEQLTMEERSLGNGTLLLIFLPSSRLQKGQ